MVDVFPAPSTVSLKDATAGSIVGIARYDGVKWALVTDHSSNGVRSFVWLNATFQDRSPVIFAENWQNNPSVLQYASNARFELDDKLDPTGHNSWETPGVIVSIGSELLIRAAPHDNFYGGNYRLVNIRSGSVYSDPLPNPLWTFLSWQLWQRDPERRHDLKLTEFNATAKRAT
ncbi:hypothetical protein [Bradyrhizobium sp. Leo170]|uniref:hypothetical protein n=1 Tax=Bradyrhizobium sp. Leo170 TaxID=1571199 RepID=UPI00102E8825|nr:hypothetical protein [Bradyrhizobium sp. Leo170]